MVKSKKQHYEKEFRDYLLFASIQNTRWGLLISLVLFFTTAIISTLLFSEEPANDYLRRFGVMVPIFVLTLTALAIKRLYRFLPGIFLSLTVLTSVAVFFVGMSSDITSTGYQYYYGWTMLVMIGTMAFYRIRLNYLLIVSVCVIIAFILAMMINGTLKNAPFTFFSTMVFIIAIFIIGLFIALYREQLMKRIFIRDRELENKNRDLKKEVRERRFAEIALKESRRNYEAALEAFPDWIHVVDKDLRFVFMNDSFKQINSSLGLETEVTGKFLEEVYPFIPEERVKDYFDVFTNGQVFYSEEKSEINGKSFYTDTRLIPIFKDKRPYQVITVIRDIARKKEIEDLRMRSAEQKEILLREIHHRVKNNLAIVISLLDMQIRHNGNPDFIKMAREVEFRIRSMALIHEHLYKSEELDRLPLDQYLKSLAYKVISSSHQGKIKFVDKLMPVDVRIETAMPVGLITNEIITNACKYAFNDHEKGILTMEMFTSEKDPGIYCLTISDNGKGLPDDFSIEEPKSLGMLIIKLLIHQIEGELKIDNSKGASFTISFKGMQTINTN